MKRNHLIWSAVLCAAVLLSGCEEQPVGYIFEPRQREQVLVARTTFDFIKSLYDHTDQAAQYLDAASLTNDYRSVLPEGWLPLPTESGDTVYVHNYLDTKFQRIQFDRYPAAGAVRTPSNLAYDYVEYGSFRDVFTNSFYGDTAEAFSLSIEYANQRQDPLNLEGWFQIQRTVEFEDEIVIGGGGPGGGIAGGSQTVTYTYYLLATWLMRIEQFSIDPRDHRGKVTLDGVFPIVDEVGVQQRVSVTSDILLDKQGRGTGEVWLRGKPVARLHFTGRGFGFNGYFTLHSEDHEKRYRN